MSNTNKSKRDLADKEEHFSDRDLLHTIISSRYDNEARHPGQSMLLMTSRDLQWKYRDMCTVSVSTVGDVMQQLDFKLHFVEGQPYWAVYPVPE